MYNDTIFLAQFIGTHHGFHGHHYGAIQDIQDDPGLDSEIENMGIGMEIHHDGGHRHTYGSHGHHGKLCH